MNKPESSVDELHARIMNLPCNELHAGSPNSMVQRAYGMGFRDARHAAAELVAAHPSNQVQEPPDGPNGPEFTDWGRAAILSVLWHHQGGSSNVGQPLRFALGKGAHEHLSEWEVEQAKKWEALPSMPTAAASPQAVPLPDVSKTEWARYAQNVYLAARTSSYGAGVPSHVLEAMRDILLAVPSEQPIAEQPNSDSVYLGSAGPSEDLQTAPPEDTRDAERWRQWRKGKPLLVTVPNPNKPGKFTTISYSPNNEPGYGDCLDAAIDAVMKGDECKT